MIYTRTNVNVFFILPTAAVGVDIDGRYFFEIGIFCWAVGLGEGPQE
jgi:hypothetical protein